MIPYIVVVCVWLASLFAVGHWQNSAGMNEQKVADQKEFDRINEKTAADKAAADVKYRQAQADQIALLTERDQLKTQLEKEHANNQAATDAVRNRYAGLGLRYKSAKAAGPGGGCASPTGAAPDSASPDGPATFELPAALAGELRQIAYDADTLADSYRECYGYAQRVR